MQEIDLKLAPEDLDHDDIMRQEISHVSKIPLKDITHYRIVRKSLDARYRPPVFLLRVQVNAGDMMPPELKELDDLPNVNNGREIHIIGAGPAGYFAAIECIKLGLKPIVMDRGKDVQDRRRDLKAIQQDGIVHPHSNYCYGEGGAGTYSDGKLYTRSAKRGSIDSVLKILVECGANPDILIEAHPHIGSNKLPLIIAQMRRVIEDHGGQIVFNTWVTDIVLTDSSPRSILSLEINHSTKIPASTVILATGHSARDIFQLLHNRNIAIEAKPFALGVRIEHSQSFIDQCQYGVSPRSPNLPAASYALNSQYKDRGVFSFCMCPGGLIVPAATSPGEIVVNGMSLSRRDSPYANSGVVTSVELSDMKMFQKHGNLMGVELQRSVEQKMFEAGNGSQAAPAQLLTDFIAGKTSKHLRETSYIPGLFSAPLHELLPPWIYERLKFGITGFNHKMNGYIHPEAVVVATESRTSSPVRIPRHPDNGMHLEIEGLFPCGEGAGYAGGIVSAAMDGQRTAKAVSRWCKEKYV